MIKRLGVLNSVAGLHMDPFKKLVLFYFSGTGNAKQVALWFSNFANTNKIECQLFDISKTRVKNMQAIPSDALILFVSPVHGFNYPKITLQFIRKFPRGTNRVVLMNTRAGMKLGNFVTPGLTGIAFLLSSLILRLKGYRIVGQIPFDMPSNWISLHPALSDEAVRFLHQKNFQRAGKHFDRIVSGKSDFAAAKDIVQDLLISPVSFAYELAGKYLFAKSFYASADCNGCGLCEKQCPVGAIKTVRDRPWWTHRCESCMKCMNSCPKRAIETAHGLLLTVAVLSSFFLTVGLRFFFPMELESELIWLSLFTVVFFFLLWVLYAFQHLLLGIKWIARLISFTSLTHYRFWGRYRSIPDHQWKDSKLRK